MTTRRGFLGLAAVSGFGVAAGCHAQSQDELVHDFEKDPAKQALASAAKSYLGAVRLREAGLFIFERRCWGVQIEEDGKQFGYGCGSYFRWLHPGQSMCPFCKLAWPTITFSSADTFIPVMDSIYPVTINYTGKPGKLNEFEVPMLDYERNESRMSNGERKS